MIYLKKGGLQFLHLFQKHKFEAHNTQIAQGFMIGLCRKTDETSQNVWRTSPVRTFGLQHVKQLMRNLLYFQMVAEEFTQDNRKLSYVWTSWFKTSVWRMRVIGGCEATLSTYHWSQLSVGARYYSLWPISTRIWGTKWTDALVHSRIVVAARNPTGGLWLSGPVILKFWTEVFGDPPCSTSLVVRKRRE